MDYTSFERHYNNGQTQLLVSKLISDTETPVSVFLKMGGHERLSILLESVEGGEVLGRYSAIGLDPDQLWICQDKASRLFDKGKAADADIFDNAPNITALDNANSNPLDHFRSCVQESHIDVLDDDLPPMLSTGFFGMLGYDMIRLIEDIPDTNTDPLNIPDAVMMRPRLMIVFDNISHCLYLATPVRLHSRNCPRDARAVYDEHKDYILSARHRIENTSAPSPLFDESKTAAEELKVTSNFTREEYKAIVKKAQEYIIDGDIFQVVPSQRFQADFELPAFALYRSLRRLNPSPFLFFLNLKDYAIVGSSPEILVRVRDQKVTIRPIAGTRKRGKNKEEDLALKKDLLSDPKEKAEHLMLLDLGRNDVGRVSEIGSVKVTDSFITEFYSHVMHIVSNVEGQLKNDTDALEALFSGFPAGTVSGAPKIRAMEIIDELESIKRKFYAGCIGYFDSKGNIDSCIALRTAMVKEGKLIMQAGGGVVADSDPDAEYEETVNKSNAIRAAALDAIKTYGASNI